MDQIQGFDLAVECMKWLPDVYRGEFYDLKNKENCSRLLPAIYAELRIADLPGPWHYKVKLTYSVQGHHKQEKLLFFSLLIHLHNQVTPTSCRTETA